MLTVEEKVDQLEAIFDQFMARTSMMLLRLDRTVERIEAAAERDRQEWNKRWAEMSAAAERDRQEWDKRWMESKKEWNKRWGELANKLGSVVEDIIAPGIPHIAQEYFGCPEIEDFMVRRRVVNKKDRSKRREFDVIAVCQDVVILNETKEYVKIAYIDQFVQFLQGGEFYDYFPEYQDKTLIPIFSSLYLADEVVNDLTKHRIYALAMSEEAVDLVNLEHIKAFTQGTKEPEEGE